MYKMSLTADLLNVSSYDVNLCQIFNFSFQDAEILTSPFLEAEWTELLNNAGLSRQQADDLVYSGIEFDYSRLFSDMSETLVNYLVSEHVELFGEGAPVQIEFTGEIDPTPDYFARSDYAALSVSIDGEGLIKLAHEYGISAVDDGRSTSGFIRTCDDRRWAINRVLSELLKKFESDQYQTVLFALEGLEITSYVTYPDEYPEFA